MMSPWKRARLLSVCDQRRKERIQDLLAASQIPYEIKAKAQQQVHPVDRAGMGFGPSGNPSPKITYIFYVQKEDVGRALELVGSAG